MAEKREFLVVIDGKESVSPAAGKASDSLGKLGDKAKATEQDFTGLDKKLQDHANTIGHLRAEIAKTGDTKLFGELGKQESQFKKLVDLRKKFVNETGQAGSAAGKLFGALFNGGLSSALKSPAGIGAVAAVAAAAAPAIGATIAGAIVGGVGIGGVVGGVMLAGSDPRVKAATASLSNQIGEQFVDAAKPFAPAVVHAVAEAKQEFQGLDDELRSIFRNSSKNLEPLAEGAAGGISKIVQGFEKLNRSAGPTVREIGAGLHDLGAEVGRVLGDLSDNGGEAADAMRNLFTVINGGVRVVGGTVNGLTELYGILRRVQAAREGDFATLAGYTNAQLEAQAALDGTAGSLEGVNLGARAAASAIDAMVAAQDAQKEGVITAAEANLRYRESLLRAAEAVDGKKKVSMDEESALLDVIKATNAATRATDDSGISADVASASFGRARDKVIALAMKMGYSKDEAIKLADSMLKIPNVKREVSINQWPAITAAKNIQKAIKDIRGKTVVINVIRTGELGADDQGAMHGGARAAGGPVKAGNIYRVGEQGPEYMVAPRDGYVISNRDSAMLAAGGVGSPVATPGRSVSGPLVLNVSPTGFNGMERMFLSWLIKAVQNAGGSTAALRL